MQGTGVTLWQMAVQGGLIMILIAILSIIVIALGVYCAFAVRKRVIIPQHFIYGIYNAIKAGDLKSAINTCKHSASPIAGVLSKGLMKTDYYMGNMNEDVLHKSDPAFYTIASSNIREIIESEGSRLSSSLRQRVAWFSHIGIIAPMFGLLGTVFGMIRAFSSIAYKVEIGKPLLLASAISEAMVTTAGGLIVGIFSMILYFYFHTRTKLIIHNMEAASEVVVDAVNMVIADLCFTPQASSSKKEEGP